MQKIIALGFTLALGLSPYAAFAANDTAPMKAGAPTSERAMSPDAASSDKVGSGRSATDKSERAMSPAASHPGTAPNGQSERAMDPNSAK